MTRDEIRETVFRLLGEIAPEIAAGSIDSGVSLRDQVDLDSIDFLNFVIAISKAFKVDVPESRYPELATIDGCVEFLAKAAG